MHKIKHHLSPDSRELEGSFLCSVDSNGVQKDAYKKGIDRNREEKGA